ncbi:hypothetical protein CLF_103777, partial [Clonorchis sinensis]
MMELGVLFVRLKIIQGPLEDAFVSEVVSSGLPWADSSCCGFDHRKTGKWNYKQALEVKVC